MDKIDALIDVLIGRISTDNRIVIASGGVFVRPEGFFIEVKAAGNVTYKTAGGQIVTESMSVGYHPTKLVEIFSTTAVDVTVIF